MKICSVRDLSDSTALDFSSPALLLYAGRVAFPQASQTKASAQDFPSTQTEHRRRENDVEQRCKRGELRHILLGSPVAIRRTIHQLHVLNYAELGLWSPISVVQNQIILTSEQGEAMSLLRR